MVFVGIIDSLCYPILQVIKWHIANILSDYILYVNIYYHKTYKK